jgi:chorismate dehydratase
VGYREYDPSLFTLDLGAAWHELTGLPFVYALWIGKEPLLTPGLAATLLRAKDWGKMHLTDIARTEYARLNETYERTLDYLTRIMHYDVGPREEQGLHLFGQKVREHGLV